MVFKRICMAAGYEDMVVGAVVLLTWMGVWYSFFFTGRASVERVRARPCRPFALLTLAVLAAVALLHALLWDGVGSSRAQAGALAPALVAAGFFALLMGQWLMLGARGALRHLSNWDVLFRISKAEVREGPYRYLRHPMYAGLLLALVGSSMMFINFFGLLFVAVVIAPLLFARAKIESVF